MCIFYHFHSIHAANIETAPSAIHFGACKGINCHAFFLFLSGYLSCVQIFQERKAAPNPETPNNR